MTPGGKAAAIAAAAALLAGVCLGAGAALRPERQPLEAEAPAATVRIAAARGVIDVDGGLVQLAAERDGIVTEVLVEEGDTVLKGQPLALIEDRAAVLQLAISEAQRLERLAAVKAQEVRLAAARRERDRLQPVAAAGAVPRKAADDADTDLRLAEADLALRRAEAATAEAELGSARYERDVRMVLAPSDGDVIRRLVRAGDGLSTLNVTALFWFAPAGARVVRAEVDEQLASLVHEGQTAEITLEGGDEAVAARGRVTRVGRALGPRRATVYEPRERVDVRVLEVIVAFEGDPLSVPLGSRVLVRFVRQDAGATASPAGHFGGRLDPCVAPVIDPVTAIQEEPHTR